MQSIFSSAENYVAEKIAATEISAEPFAHCVIDDVFPPDLLSAIHKNWPSDEELVPLPETGRSKAYSERYVLLFEDKYFNKMNKVKREFWIQAAVQLWAVVSSKRATKKFRDIPGIIDSA